MAVLNHLRPWLPVLLALSANSPFHQGADTGHASWRTLVLSRWPTHQVPPYFESAEHYDRTVTELRYAGVLPVRAANAHWFARPSAHLPTVEVRIADVTPSVDEAVLRRHPGPRRGALDAVSRAAGAAAARARGGRRPVDGRPPRVRGPAVTRCRGGASRRPMQCGRCSTGCARHCAPPGTRRAAGPPHRGRPLAHGTGADRQRRQLGSGPWTPAISVTRGPGGPGPPRAVRQRRAAAVVAAGGGGGQGEAAARAAARSPSEAGHGPRARSRVRGGGSQRSTPPGPGRPPLRHRGRCPEAPGVHARVVLRQAHGELHAPAPMPVSATRPSSRRRTPGAAARRRWAGRSPRTGGARPRGRPAGRRGPCRRRRPRW